MRLTPCYQETCVIDRNIYLTLQKDFENESLYGKIVIQEGSKITGDPTLREGELSFTIPWSHVSRMEDWIRTTSKLDTARYPTMTFSIPATHVESLVSGNKFCLAVQLVFRFGVSFFGVPYLEVIAQDPTSLHWTAPRLKFEFNPTRRIWRRRMAVLFGAHKQSFIREHLRPLDDFLKIDKETIRTTNFDIAL